MEENNNKIIRIGVTTAKGRMGRAVVNYILNNQEKLRNIMIAVVYIRNLADLDVIQIEAKEKGLVTYSDKLEDLFIHTDIIIDYSKPDFLLSLSKYCQKYKKPMISGTTGISEEQMAIIKSTVTDIGLVIATNTSIIMNIFFSLTNIVSKLTKGDYDAEIIEAHHNKKVDSPSGTAITLGENIAMGRGQRLADVMNLREKGIIGERSKEEIGFSVIRGGGIIGEHEVSFISDNEKFSLKHTSFSRDIYVEGAIGAAKWLYNNKNKKGVFSMNDILGLEDLYNIF